MAAPRLDQAQPSSWILGHLQMRQIQRLVEAKAGLRYATEKDETVRRRIVVHADRWRAPSFEAYLRRLSEDAACFEDLVNEITINETFMYRDSHQLAVWAERLAGPAGRARGRLRVWSAACSTGEEPVTISLILRALQAQGTFDFEIDASDVNTAVIEKARSGVFPERSTKDVPRDALASCFDREADGFRARPEILAPIRFFAQNLCEPLDASREPYDFVFLRNVMIYFPDDVRARVLSSVADSLREGGHLLMGHCESPAGNSDRFVRYDEPGTFIFRKA